MKDPTDPSVGAPQKYGEKVKVCDLFRTEADKFIESEVFLYGKNQKVRYLVKDLIWKPLCDPDDGVKRMIRFVAVEVVGSGKHAVLMCSDLNLSPPKDP